MAMGMEPEPLIEPWKARANGEDQAPALENEGELVRVSEPEPARD